MIPLATSSIIVRNASFSNIASLTAVKKSPSIAVASKMFRLNDPRTLLTTLSAKLKPAFVTDVNIFKIENKPVNVLLKLSASSSVIINVFVNSLNDFIAPFKLFAASSTGVCGNKVRNASPIGLIIAPIALNIFLNESSTSSRPPNSVIPSTRSSTFSTREFEDLVASFKAFKVASSTTPVTLSLLAF